MAQCNLQVHVASLDLSLNTSTHTHTLILHNLLLNTLQACFPSSLFRWRIRESLLPSPLSTLCIHYVATCWLHPQNMSGLATAVTSWPLPRRSHDGPLWDDCSASLLASLSVLLPAAHPPGHSSASTEPLCSRHSVVPSHWEPGTPAQMS